MADQFTSDVWVGSEVGYLKAVDLQKKLFNNVASPASESDGKKPEEICRMCWKDTEQNQMILGLRNGLLKTFDINPNTITAERDCEVQGSHLVGLFCHDRSTVTCTESGVLRTWEEHESESPINMKVGNHISIMCNSQKHPHLVGTGGKENDLKIWDLSRGGESIFKAKNVRNDTLDLRVPVWVTSLGFLPSGGSSSKVITGTGYHQIRLYDTAAKKRPVMSVEFEGYPISALAVTNQEHNVIIGNTAGTMAALDLRKAGQVVGHYKGFAGGIRCIEYCEERGQMAACGLDRFVRVYDVTSRGLLHKVYLKTRLNCILFSRNDTRNQDKTSILNEECGETNQTGQRIRKRERTNEEDDEEADRIWHSMEVVGTEKTYKKKKSSKKKAKGLTS